MCINHLDRLVRTAASLPDPDSVLSSETVTIILTTSPTPSCPSPELVGSVLASLPASFTSVPIIISFDGFTVSTSDRRVNGRLKRGQIPKAMADQYPTYIKNVMSLFAGQVSPEVEDRTMHTFVSTTHGPVLPVVPDQELGLRPTYSRDVTFVRHKYRQGFGFSVKSALSHVRTPLVLVLQHDWVFAAPMPPMDNLVQIMMVEEEVNYISFVTRLSRCYERSRGESHVNYRAVFDAARRIRCGRVLEHDLVACLHFFDRPHLCKVSLYRDIFKSGIIKRGDFLEDTLGTSYLMSIAHGVDDRESIIAWKKLGAWLYYPGDGDQVAIRHTAGRTSLARSDQEERIRGYISMNQLNKS